MEQTLKELAGDLQVIHESLERAEVIERQLGVYWREFAEERDQLRAEVETASGNARLYADKCTALEAEVERLRVDYEQLTQLCKATEERERDAITTAAGLRRALEEIDSDVAGLGWTKTGRTRGRIDAALAASPDEHARKLKAEALRDEIPAFVALFGPAAGDALEAEADRLEAAERERERLCEDRHFAINMIRQMDPENLCDFFDDIGAEQELQRWLAERDSRQRRKGAKEAYEEARRITLTAGEKADIYDRLNERLVGLREGGE